MSKPRKIKIMHIINNLEVGGAEKMLVLLLNELAKRNDVELHLVSLEGHGPLISDISKKVTIKNFHYKLFNKLSRFDVGIKPQLISYVKKINPDVIHGHLIKGEDIAKVVGAITKTPVIITSHDMLTIPGAKTKFLNRYITKAVAVSQPVADHLVENYGIDNSKIKIIPNAIDVAAFKSGWKKFNIKKPVFIYIGRLLESKGIEDAIRGLAKLRAEYTTIEFLIYGKEVFESYKKHLQKIVIDNGWDFVKFMGRTEDVPGALTQGDIFILPSLSEGFAISVLEAAAAKKPIIATRVGVIPEIVRDGVSGYLVDFHAPGQIYDAAKKILDDNLIEQYGNEAFKLVGNQFDKEQMTQAYLDLYRDVVK